MCVCQIPILVYDRIRWSFCCSNNATPVDEKGTSCYRLIRTSWQRRQASESSGPRLGFLARSRLSKKARFLLGLAGAG